MRVIIKATVTTRRNGQTPKHASQHVPAAFPSGGAYRYIALPHRKLAFPRCPTFRSLRFSPSAAWDPHLCELSKNLITSFVYSHDLVSRLSLGTMRDVSRAAVWLCKAEAEGRPEGYSGVTRRALRHKMGFGTRDDPIWVRVLPQTIARLVFAHNDAQFLSIRKTLEANMPLHNLYPPGRVLWAVRDSDLSYAAPPPAERRYSPMEALRAHREEDGVRLFEVLDVEKVFSQIIFSRDMVRYESHASL
jgi:sn1-specific diacylglycerol lipase